MNPPRNSGTEERTSATVIRTVAAYANKEPTELPPLTEAVDPDALDALFAPQTDGTPRFNGRLTFRYAGFRVTVSADDPIEVDLQDLTGE